MVVASGFWLPPTPPRPIERASIFQAWAAARSVIANTNNRANKRGQVRIGGSLKGHRGHLRGRPEEEATRDRKTGKPPALYFRPDLPGMSAGDITRLLHRMAGQS